MVNITVLQRISNLIKKFAGPMKKWSERSRYKRDGDLMRYTKMMVRQIRKIMLLVSGNDIIEMLRGKFEKSVKISIQNLFFQIH